MTADATIAVHTDSRQMVITDPRDDGLVARIPVAGRDQLISALESAWAEFPFWSSTPAADRGAALRRVVPTYSEQTESSR